MLVDNAAVLRLTFAPAAMLLRVNHGWLATDRGGLVDFQSGEVETESRSGKTLGRARRIELVKLAVRGTQNILLVRCVLLELLNDAGLQTPLRYPIQRAAEQCLQLAESELAAERAGDD